MTKPSYLLRASWLSLHTGDPGIDDGGRQLTHEVAYEGYKRVQVRCKFKKHGIALAEDVSFPTCTGGYASSLRTVTHWGLGTEASGNGYVWWSGDFQPPIFITNGVVPIVLKGLLIAHGRDI